MPGNKDISLEPLLNARTPQIAGYIASDQSVAGATTYFGFLDRDGNWYIQRQVVAGDDIAWRYCKGSGGYAVSWAARAGLTYDYYSTTFP
jgi:hypothetical protein